MRANPTETNDESMAEATHQTGSTSKNDVIEEALCPDIPFRKQESVRALRGQLRWEGDLDVMRKPRVDYAQ